ncbi:nucleoprotein TPR-like isoform X3 [Salarias fasciatus]|uniref:nucleoprotein TPR-like isoform X3 n=1 Tax=Salarias fasciatus TaxID=181472 RepID=UPI0011769EAB|nr:nucleoprotein TPR-like isoform X3 [Salarias fasciatus]
MAAVLLQALERPELNKLPKGVQNKLEKFVTELQNANEALRTQHERFKADSEQQYFDIEKRLLGSQEQILSATKDLQTVKEENKKLNEELSTLKGIEGETGEVKPTQQQTKAKYEIEAEKRELARLLEKRTQEVENLTEDVKRLNEKLTDANKVKMELQLKLDGIESSAASVQHREKRMEQEKELLEKKAEWLSAELKTKTEELLKTSREKGKEILELQGNLKISKEQVNRLESQLTSLKQINENQNKRAEDLNNKLKQSKDELSAMDEKYRNELNAHVKLSSLYKGSATEMETKNQELSRAVEALTKLVKDTGEASKALEKKLSESEELKKRIEAELREKVTKMEKELENATLKASGKHCCGPSLTEEQLDSMCPSAAAIAAIVKPGMKFFDLYNAYAECQTQLQLEKQETRRVSKVLDEIVQEVESKAPVLKRQREEYEGMQRSTASLFNKLEQARTEIYSLQKEKEEAKQQNEALQREKQRIETQLEDTSAQVCSLLVDLEEARGNRVSKNDGSSTDISSTSEVLSARQISFRSVEELQRQNQSLLGRLRELEEEKDRQKGQVTSARISELESSMAKLKTEMELLREQRNQQKQLSDSNARQRDMYKALLTQSTGFSLPPQGQDSSASAAPVRPSVPATRSTPQRAAAAESAQTAQAKAALKQLNDAFTLYKKEKAENDRMLNETNDRLQRQLTEFRSSHAKLTSQLEFSNKRYEMLQETVNAYRREISALQERNQKMAATAQRHEHIIHTMSQDLRQTNEKLALEEVRVENLSKERDLLRQAESRLNREKEAMLAEQRNQNLLLTNLKSIQLTMERTDTETRQRLNNKIEKLEAELSSMKTRMDQEIAQRHALGRTMDAQLLEAKKQLETQNTLQQKTRELLRTSEQQVASLKAQLAAASSSEAAAASTSATPATRAAALRAPLRVRSPVPAAPQQSSQSEQELSEVKGLLRAAEEQNNELTEQLKNTNATVQQYRSVVLTLEDSLKKEKESRSPLELRVKESEELQKQLEKRILEVEKMKQQEEEERRKAMDAVEKQVSELQRSLKSSQTEQQEALERAAAAVTLEQKAIQESLLQTKLAGEAQSKYERELMLHAADVEALQELKKKFQQDTTRKRELEEQLKKTSALLQEKTAAWNAAEKKMKEDQANQNRRCEELGKQNALLHQQMDELATKSRQLQQQQHQQQLDLSFSEEGKTTEQILEILRFVRREKEIAETRCEASDKEALRYKQRVEHQDREIKELHEALNVERERMQATVKTLAQQEEQLKKMETISALQENNRMLKMDRDKLEQELNQAQVKLSKLQADISPLHHSLSQLSEKNGSLQADRRLLEEDLKRWKARAQQLMSQQKDGDTEERQKLIAEKEAHLRRITNLAEETGKLKTELARANATSNLAQTQVQGLKDAIARLTSERDSLKKEVENSNNVILEKNKTITQVKKIGRRYKTQFDELKAQHDKFVAETAAKAGSEAAPSQEAQQELSKAQEELSKTREELSTLKEEAQKKQEEVQKSQQMLEAAQKENQQTKEKLQEVQNQLTQNQNQLTQNQNQLTQVQSQLSQTQNQLQQNQNQLTQSQKELQQAKNHTQQVQNQLKAAQSQAQARQNQIQQIQRELQQAKESLQQNVSTQKEQQQSLQTSQQKHNQEVNSLKTSLSQAESKVTELQGQLENVQKAVSEREADIKRLQEQLTEANQAKDAAGAAQSSQVLPASDANAASERNQALQEELSKLRQELSETKSREEQLKQQMSDKEEKTKKVFMGAKTKINQLNTAKEKLSQEIEELKQSKEELEVRMNALKSQYEGRLLRQDRELRELRETQTHSEPREEPQDQSGAKVRAAKQTEQAGDQTRPADPRQMSLKSPAQDRGSSSLSEPPTANIRPTPSTPSPSNKPSPSPGSKATPRASIRPMVTPAPVPVPTPTATVMPTTQTDSQEALMSAGGSVHSTSSGIVNAPASLNQPTSSQATAFVQPTQQQIASQDAASSVDSERPSTSSSLPATAGSKRTREDEEDEDDSRPESSQTPPSTKKFRLKPAIALQMEGDEEIEGDLDDEEERQDSPDDSQELPEEGFPMLAEDEEEEGVSQSVPSDQMSSQESALIRDVIVIDTDSESQESKEEPIQEAEGEEEEEEEEEEGEEEEEEEEEYKEGEEEDDNDDDAADSGLRGEESNEESREAQDDEEEEEEPTEGGNNAEDGSGVASSDQQRPSESAHGGDGSSEATPDSDAPRDSVHFPPTSTSSLAPSPSSSSLTPRLPHTRRPPHALPPRLYIQPPAPELGPPPTQRQSSQLRRPSAGRGPQLTPGIGTMPFFDDDDRMVPSTPTLVVPHRTDGFAEAIHSPQVAGLSTRFRFGPPEDLLPQTSASHSDLGQLASQGGLGMYESPLFLPAHDEDGGGRSVPTTPLQVAAPVTVFTESLPSDSTDNMASQSVPMVTASSGMAAAADDGDEVFMEHEGDGPSIESSLDSQTDMESTGQQSDDASLPSTSQVPDTSSVPLRRTITIPSLLSGLPGRGARAGRGEARTLLSRRGTFSRGGRGGAMGRGGFAQ